MPPTENEALVLRMQKLELTQIQQEKDLARGLAMVNDRVDSVEETVKETHAIVKAVNDNVVTLMGAKTVDVAIDRTVKAMNEKRKMSLWQWLAIVGAFVGPTAIERIFKLIGWS